MNNYCQICEKYFDPTDPRHSDHPKHEDWMHNGVPFGTPEDNGIIFLANSCPKKYQEATFLFLKLARSDENLPLGYTLGYDPRDCNALLFILNGRIIGILLIINHGGKVSLAFSSWVIPSMRKQFSIDKFFEGGRGYTHMGLRDLPKNSIINDVKEKICRSYQKLWPL